MITNFGHKFLLGALFATATTLTAAADTINVKLVDAGNPADIASSVTIGNDTKSNVYIGPYTLSVNGTDVLAMCIDFNIESPVGATYTANQTTVGSSDLSKTYGESGKVYEEEAYLYSQIVQPGADRLAIQEAAWDITAFNITSDLNFFTYLGDNIANLSVAGYINSAVNNASSMSGQYAIISDVVNGGQQEFIVDPPISSSVTPEPSSFMLMLAPAMAGAEAIRRKRQNASLLS